jgi:uncharacterized protein YyaL (SSP411 family)
MLAAVKRSTRRTALAVTLSMIAACKSGCAQSTPPPQVQGGGIKGGGRFDLPGAPPASPEIEERLTKGLAAHGPDYKPRSRHLRDDGSPTFTNRLILETSPYLLQHAHNPVNWFAWSDEAFATARSLHRPILLSIGYSTCHWCHVMEVESFEDEEIAAYINSHFVAIKVDREERPDIDSIYMNAVQLMTHRGGWPMTVVMTADARPFFGGTYFPPRDGAQMGLLTILRRLHEAYIGDPKRIEDSAKQLSEMLELGARNVRPQGMGGPDQLATVARELAARFDPGHGGFGVAPKFPRPAVYELLLRIHRRSGDETALAMVRDSLQAMIRGGIHDQIGGGFHRYSTDQSWLVPHFEKMLYDNAQLASLLVELHQRTDDSTFGDAARETLNYVAREMTSPRGGFYSATDADSEGDEGRFFLWTRGEVEKVLGAERGRVAESYFGMSADGTFEGRNILHRPRDDDEVARELGLRAAELARLIGEAKKQLYEAREKRVHPLRDDKILTEWNAQMISAFATAGFHFGDDGYLERAKRAALFILEQSRHGGRLDRESQDRSTRHQGMLEDYAFLTAALIDLFEATSERRWLEEAIALSAELEAQFLDEKDGGFFETPKDGEQLLIREKPFYDGAQPSGNAIAALSLLRLGELTSNEHYRELAARTLMALGSVLEHSAIEAPMLACALDFYLDKPKEVVIITAPGDTGSALKKVVRQTYLPNRIYVAVEDGPPAQKLSELVPVIKDKRALRGRTTAYVCMDHVCEAPTSSPEVLSKELSRAEPLLLERKLVLPRGGE